MLLNNQPNNIAMSKKQTPKTAARKKASITATKKISEPSSPKVHETTYKTQGIITSVSLERNNSISFIIDPVEPYDFPVKEKDETKKCVLLQPISEETNNGMNEATKAATENEEILKVPPSTRFSIAEKGENCVAPFGDLILLKQNRNKIELEVAEKKIKKPSPNADKANKGEKSESESNESSPDDKMTGLSFFVLKLTVK